MAPGRKRAKGGGSAGGEGGGGGGPKSKAQLNIGDLVLAKVKGFPAWPAKISRPEDWDRAPDPKKYFVQFYGTEEIAFVAPADIQAFTSDSKNKLAARCRGKTVKYFAQAVREISEEFERLQHQSPSGLRDDKSPLAFVTDVHSADGEIGDAIEADLKEVSGNKGINQPTEVRGLGDHGTGSQRQEEMDHRDIKSTFDDGNGGLSKRSKFCDGRADLVKKEVMSTSISSRRSLHKETSCERRVEESSSRQMSHGGGSKVSENYSPDAAEEGLTASLSSEHENYPDVADDFRNGRKSRVASGDEADKRIGFGGKQSSQNLVKSDGGKKVKKLLKDNKNFDLKDKPQTHVEESSVDEVKFSSKKQGQGKQISKSNEVSDPARRSKCDDVTDDSKVSLQSRKVEAQMKNKKMVEVEGKRSVVLGKGESQLDMRTLSSTTDSNLSGDEDVLPPPKRRRRALEAMSTASALNFETRIGRSSAVLKNDMSRRRAVRLCDDDEEEEPKTPVHEGSTKKVLANVHGPVSTKRGDVHTSFSDQFSKRGSGPPEGQSAKKLVLSGDQLVEHSSPNSQQTEEKKQGKATAFHISFSPGKLESEKVSLKESKQVSVSPRSSPLSFSAVKSVTDLQKSYKLSGKVPSNMHQRKATASDPGVTSECMNSTANQQNERCKPEISADRNKATPKSHPKTNDVPLPLGMTENRFLQGERSEDGKDDKLSSSIDQRSSDSVLSMKHLIAAAQAKKKQAHLQNFSDNPNFLLALNTDEPVRTPSPAPVAQPMGSSSMAPSDVQGFLPKSSMISPPSDIYHASSTNQHDTEEFVEGISSGHRTAGGSLSGGTEAAVSRDAFEGMIETLSRTKDSIGRATRLAIDCAKYGLANEVVELLIRKLESESSFHRKVDLFFLVDSITQCSHSHKGIAGASYIPAVQAALPRLLVAAAPPGPGARENRRQCLKVLRLWLERKILPDSLLRRYMEDIGVVSDDTSSGLSLRRPSRAERAIDDPIREMEGMLVDEYGSNATYQLSGFFSSHVFEEEEEEEETHHTAVQEAADLSPLQRTPAAGDFDNYNFTPNEKRHHILEDVDGELEMEDVSGHQKDERSPMTGDTLGTDPSNVTSVKIGESTLSIPFELPPLPEGSPPLPLDSPPATPPLPSSLPPSPLQPPMPPPMPLSPAPALAPAPAPAPPPPPLLQPHAILPSIGLPPPVLPQPSLPPQPSMASQHVNLLPSSNLASSVAAYQNGPVLPEIGGNPGVNPLTKVAGNASHGPPVDASVRNEMFAQQGPSFVPIGVGTTQEPSRYSSTRSLEYGHSNMYANSLASQPNMQFQPGNVPFTQRPLPPNPPPQGTPSHFSYPVPTIRHHSPAVQHHPPPIQNPLPPVQHPPPHSYTLQYSVPNFADGSRHFSVDEQWRMRPSDLNSDQRGVWMHGVRSCSGPAYAQDGYPMPPPEKPSVGAASFQPSVLNTYPSGTSVPGHGVNNIIPGRPDMSAFSWRPA
ncbi:unnamed protein product [Coffea canephora]|uniref:CID domain-containing protein n=1 Tax=Coffea canephora TaxID=49390 RepID=A0A068UTR1_COFCA|nr:unnamed protein product [Coffea canephora]